MKIYTRKGDAGRTGVLGGERVPKHDVRVEAYGAVDELNAALGVAIAAGMEEMSHADRLRTVQSDLLTVGARLAAAEPEKARRKGTIPELPGDRIGELEAWIDALEGTLPALDAFLLPGGAPAGAQLHVARTICRRAERKISQLLPAQPGLSDVILPYMNRLSDLLFVLARATNRAAGAGDVEWRPVRRS